MPCAPSWAYELMADYHLPEAIAVLKLNVHNCPDSGDVYDSLADACMRSGRKQLAIDCKALLEARPAHAEFDML
jgi:hypothetical protein